MLECSGVNCRNAAKGVWEGEPYCGVHLASRRAADKRSAKCRLERAAPELLAALRDMVAAIYEPDKMSGVLVNKAEAAIAKAEGSNG